MCLEITESVALHDLDNTRRFVDKVRGYGAKVALDDFGAGYTSFSYLKEFKADLLKIDGSFIVNMNQHPANIAIVEAIVSLANNLGMKVIAEWAEDNATVQTLTEIGVDYVQGFAVARPQHPDKLALRRVVSQLYSGRGVGPLCRPDRQGQPNATQGRSVFRSAPQGALRSAAKGASGPFFHCQDHRLNCAHPRAAHVGS